MNASGFNVRTTVRRTVKPSAGNPRGERETLIASLVNSGEVMHLTDLRILTNAAGQCAKDGALHDAGTTEKHRRRRARPARPAELRVVQGPPMRVTDDRNENTPDFKAKTP